MNPVVLRQYPDLVLSVGRLTLGEKAREKMKDKRKKEKQREDILRAACGLLNSGGGVIFIEPESEDYDFSTDALGQDVERALTKLVHPARVNEFFQFGQQDSKFYIFVKSWCSSGKRPRICSISTGLWQRSETSVEQFSPIAVEELLRRRKNKVSESDKIYQFYERVSVNMNELLCFGESTTVDFKDFRTEKMLVRLGECLPKYISAFANTAGGFLFIGVDDGRRVTGCGRGEKKEELQRRLEEICSKAIAFHRRTCPRSRSWAVEHRIIDVLDENVPEPRYVLAIRVPPSCCVVFEKHPDSWLIEDCELRPVTAEWWLGMMDRADPVDELTGYLERLSFKCTPQSPAVYGFKDQHLERLQTRLFPIDEDDIAIGPEPLKEDLFGKYENLRNLQTLERQQGDRGVLIFSRSWAVDVGSVKNGKVICDALLISQNSLPCLYTVVREEESRDLWEYATSTALQIKQKLVNVGGYEEVVCVAPKLVSCQTGELISREQISPDGRAEIPYPDIYKLSTVDEVESLLRSLVTVLLSFTSALSDELGYEFLNLLTEEQFKFLQTYEDIRELFIHGLPGSGKTVLAVEKIKRIKNEYGCTKEDILYICENQPLRNFMGKKDICKCVTRSKFMFWGGQYFSDVKHIIVDEGQNFRREDGDWYKKARNIVNKNGIKGVFWVFLDYFQQSHDQPSGLPPVDQQNRAYLCTVVRNSTQVFERLKQEIDGFCESNFMKKELIAIHCRKMHGQLHFVHSVKGSCKVREMAEGEVVSHLRGELRQLLEHGLSQRNIAILCSTASDSEELKQALDLKRSRPIISFTTAEDSDKDAVVLDSIRRFSGLERNVVILIDPRAHPFQSKVEPNLLIAAISRARIRLIVIKFISTANSTNSPPSQFQAGRRKRKFI